MNVITQLGSLGVGETIDEDTGDRTDVLQIDIRYLIPLTSEMKKGIASALMGIHLVSDPRLNGGQSA